MAHLAAARTRVELGVAGEAAGDGEVAIERWSAALTLRPAHLDERVTLASVFERGLEACELHWGAIRRSL